MDIAIIGGGAAGMMAAAFIAEQNTQATITLIEQNQLLGRKVRMTGGGRCNLTTGLSPIDEILRRYPRGQRFLKHALYDFPPAKVIEWFEGHGVPLKTEPDLRVFPQSDRSDDIVSVFEIIYQKFGVRVLFNTAAQNVTVKDGKFIITAKNNIINADRLLISAGGRTSHIVNSYEIAKSLGHSVTDLAPSLCSFIANESWVRELSGVSFKGVNLSLNDYKFKGSFVFTHKGITGPAIFAISALSAHEVINPEKPANLYIDLIPETNEEMLLSELQKAIIENRKKNFLNVLAQFTPKSVADIICRINGIMKEKMCAEISKKELNKAAHSLKSFNLTIIGRSAGEEFVTAGGVNLEEVDPKTMQSKICPGLFFAGEILDVDAFTGGFNLQAAWATGRLAGINMLK